MKSYYILIYLKQIFSYLFSGFRKGVGKQRLLYFFKQCFCAIEQIATKLEEPGAKSLERLQKLTTGLHSLLPRRDHFTYSILCTDKRTAQSAASLTAPNLEVVFDAEAKGNYLLYTKGKQIFRPDLLYRFEQVLQTVKEPENTVVFCDAYLVNSRGVRIPGSEIRRKKPPFPYVFSDEVGPTLLIPKRLFAKKQGLDQLLHLDAAGAEFVHLPFALVGLFEEQERQAVHSLPELSCVPKIHAIVPYKDQKEITLKAVKSLFSQESVQVSVTAVDNGSADRSIAVELEAMGVEVIPVNEPFNYSMLNNFALEKSMFRNDLLLFFNNDVVLEKNALLEMSRWVNQPKIGLVGCRLRYPNGRLQHGGIRLNREGQWEDIKGIESPSIVDAVTAACALMKRALFEEVGGFDEIRYPIAYSDTNLAVKLQKKGYQCFYTPFASGVHHESLTRKKGNIEDVERSRWFDEYHH